jgi:hypothetical protein
MTWIHLAPLVDPSPWNGVTITTAILSVAAIVVTLIVLAVTWANIPKPYFVNESYVDLKGARPVWNISLVNRGAGDATDLTLLMRGPDKKWVWTATWPLRPGGRGISHFIFFETDSAHWKARLTWRTHPMPWLVRRKTIKLVYDPKSNVVPREQLDVY